MIPGKIFTSFAKVQRIISVNDFRLPVWFQDLFQALLFLEKFLFCTDTIGSIVCPSLVPPTGISMIVPRFTFFTENFVIRCNQVTKMLRSCRNNVCSPCWSIKTPLREPDGESTISQAVTRKWLSIPQWASEQGVGRTLP